MDDVSRGRNPGDVNQQYNVTKPMEPWRMNTDTQYLLSDLRM